MGLMATLLHKSSLSRCNLVILSRFLQHIVLLTILCFAVTTSYTQNHDSLSLIRSKTIIFLEGLDSIYFEENTIVPESIEIYPPSTQFFINPEENIIYRKSNSVKKDTIKLTYRVFPFSIQEEKSLFREYESAKQDSIERDIFIINRQKPGDVFDFDNLKVEGGLGRSLNVGNKQNLVVNSNLNLRLSGTVADDIKVVGVLTDDNVPFQPQGNSQQIRELDQVFLQFSKDNHQVTLGDYEYRKPESYFLNFDKRLQGVNYLGSFETKNNWSITTSNSGAVSRGKYARNQFLGEEGNQGPYKLFGSNNESFIIILAGTEQVFIDGVQVERGLDRDYIIDYNTGEITFTSRQLITNRKRISIEFEYSNQTYNSSMIFSETEFSKGPLSFRLNLYSQQDNKNRARVTDTVLNTNGLFGSIGEGLDGFFIDSFQEERFNPERIQYRLALDSLVNDVVYDSVFVASKNPNEQLYRVIFTFVGENMGDYELSNELTNGRQYQFIPRLNGVPQGNYAAKLRLDPPSQQQMASLTSSYSFSKYHRLSIETSFSNRDLNTLSDIGNEDNQGMANLIKWENTQFLSQDSTKNVLQIKANYELRNKNFRAIERYRPVEFSRNWNVINNTDSLGEGYGNISLQYLLNSKTRLGYQLSQYNQSEDYSGFNHTATIQKTSNGLNVRGKVNYLHANQRNIDSRFFRPQVQIDKNLGQFSIGTRLQQNIREFSNQTSGNLEASSIGDEDYSIYISSSDSTRIPIKLQYNKHIDSTPLGNQLTDLFSADEVSFSGSIRKSRNHKANFTFTYRNLEVVDTSLTNESDKTSLLGKFNYSGNFLKGVIRTGFDYELGSGREPKREFSYIQVANGEGVYTWIDYNNNGSQEITEFEIAPFSDQAEYVRVFTNTNEFINADTGRLNQWIQIEPAIQWRNEEGIKGFLGKFSVNSTMNLQSKRFQDAPGQRFNPYTFNVDREGLVSTNNRINNRLIYNKLSNKFRSSYIFQTNQAKNQLLSGFEQRNRQEHKILTDIYFENKLTLQLQTGWLRNEFLSENFSAKTFDFEQYKIQPKLTWVLSNQMRIGSFLSYSYSENDESLGGQSATTNSFSVDYNWNKRNDFALTARINYDNIEYNGELNDAVSFSMLNGLQNGNNILWNVGFEKSVLQALRVNLTYNGRKLGEQNPVHTGRARITAVF